MKQHCDPFTVEVIRNALASAAEEMSSIVKRSSRSAVLREAGDHSSAITDGEGGLIAQGKDLPVHLGVMSYSVGEFLKYADREELKPGDVWIMNLPEVGGNHLPDVKLIKPIFWQEKLMAFAVSVAHWGDIGGGAPGSYFAGARSIWQEGLQIPPMRICVEESLRQDILDFILWNVRGREDRHGDLLAQISAVRAAEANVQALLKSYGSEVFNGAVAALSDLSERQMRNAIGRIPDGTYKGTDWIDSDGAGGPPVPIVVNIRIEGTSAVFDFSETADAVPGPMNTTRFVAATAAGYFLKALARSEVYHSAGALRPVSIVTRRGSLLDPGPFAPVVAGNHETSHIVVDTIIRAMSAAVPLGVGAGGSSTSGILIFSGTQHGRWWSLYEVHSGGEGARAERPGASVARMNLGNMMNTPIERIEAEYPLRVCQQKVRRGSGGRGRQRGGDGLVREYLLLEDNIELTTVVHRRIVPPFGLFGGADGAGSRITLMRGGEPDRDLEGLANYSLRKGDRVLIEMAGGGGYGAS